MEDSLNKELIKELAEDAAELLRVEREGLKYKMLEGIVRKQQDPLKFSDATSAIGKHLRIFFHMYTWRDDISKEVWMYKDGVYVNNGITLIEKEIKSIIGDCCTQDIVNKIIFNMKIDTYINPDEFITKSQSHRSCINVKNGIVLIDNLNPYSKTYEISIVPHTHEEIHITQIPVTYNPDAKCPHIEKFIKESISNEDDIKTIYEAIGATLLPEVITKKAVITYGEKDTGKTTLSSLITTFLGRKNCSHLNIQQLTETQFAVSELYGKIANLCGDLSQDDIKNPERFKEVTGGDWMDCDRKFKTYISFFNRAKLFCNLNVLPRIPKADDAFWNRLMPFEFSKKHYDKKTYDALTLKERVGCGIKDETLLSKMSTPQELSGLLNLALEGLQRYLRNGGFSYSQGVAEVRKKWIRLSDSFMAFALDNIEIAEYEEPKVVDDVLIYPQTYITRKDLSSKYHKYCMEHKIKSVGDKCMKNTLNFQYGVYTDGYTCVPGINERCWDGIKWKK